jgi:predicted PilT family ATPase
MSKGYDQHFNKQRRWEEEWEKITEISSRKYHYKTSEDNWNDELIKQNYNGISQNTAYRIMYVDEEDIERLIGRQGRQIRIIKKKSNANITVSNK